MKTLILLGIMVVGAGAQTENPVAKPEKPPIPAATKIDNSNVFTLCDKNTSANCISDFTLARPEPCGWLGTWDDAQKVCAIHVTFGGNDYGPITCSPVSADPDGSQHMICWYKPKGAKP